MKICKNYNPCLWPELPKFSRILEEIGVEEHDGDVRFNTGSGNMAVSCMCIEKYAI